MKQARIKAKKRYNDIQENRSIKKNEVYVVSLKRAEEIVKANLCDILDIYDVKQEDKPDYSGLIVTELKRIAKDRNIDVKGLKKDEIINKLNVQ